MGLASNAYWCFQIYPHPALPSFFFLLALFHPLTASAASLPSMTAAAGPQHNTIEAVNPNVQWHLDIWTVHIRTEHNCVHAMKPYIGLS